MIYNKQLLPKYINIIIIKRNYSINTNYFERDYSDYKVDAHYKDYKLLISTNQELLCNIPVDINNKTSEELLKLYNIKIINNIKPEDLQYPIQVKKQNLNKYQIYNLTVNDNNYIIINWYTSSTTSYWSIYNNKSLRLILTFSDILKGTIKKKRNIYLTYKSTNIITFTYKLSTSNVYTLESIHQNNKWKSLSEVHNIKKKSSPIVDIATLDIETFTNTPRNPDSSNAIVYQIGYSYKSAYNNSKEICKTRYKSNIITDLTNYLTTTKLDTKIYYLTDYLSQDKTDYIAEHDIIINCLENLCLDCGLRSEEGTLLDNKHYHVYSKRKWNKTTVYIHNLGDFDSKFLTKHLLEHKISQEAKGLKNYLSSQAYVYNNKVLIISLNYNKHTVYLRDSINLLPNSLSKLCKSFNLPQEISKDIFPYHFPNITNLDYKGVCPSLSNFPKNITKEDYEHYKQRYNNKVWDIKHESGQYLELDLKSLWYIIDIFRYTTLNKYKLDITTVNTVAKLALNILHNQYKGLENIPFINKNDEDNYLRISLYGGLTSVFKPRGSNLYYYDVNSFYPHIAASDSLPSLNYQIIKYTEPQKYNPTFHVGIWTALITTPENDYLGLLPFRNKIYNNNITVFPLGKFIGTWTHAELNLAHKNNYKIEIIEGFKLTIKPSPIKTYINNIYRYRKHTTNQVENLLYKLLLNSLLGRFALNTNKPRQNVSLSQQEIIEWTDTINNIDFINNIEISINEFFTNNTSPSKESSLLSISEVTYNTEHEKILTVNKNAILVSYSSYFKNYYKDYQDYLSKSLDQRQKKPLHASQTGSNDTTLKSVITTSYINSLGRVKLNHLLLSSIKNGSQIYYCDTDSLVVDTPLPSKYQGTSLGKLKLEYKVKEGYFINNKLYCLELHDKTLRKAQRGTNSDLTLQAYIDIYNGLEHKTTRSVSIGSLTDGNVIIQDVNLTINQQDYLHRNKIYNKSKNWIDTHPVKIFTNQTKLSKSVY